MLPETFDTRSGAATLSAFLRDDRGTTAIEYAIIAGGIAAVIIAIVSTIGVTLQTDYYGPVAEKLGGG